MKKNLITLLCLLTFVGCAYAEVYQVPGSYVETVTEVTTPADTTQLAETTVKEKRNFKFIRKHRKDYNPTNSYWNFGRPPFWTGSI